MKFIMKYFPFFLLLLIFYSCKKENINFSNKNKSFNTLTKKGYNNYINGNYDSSFVYFNKAKTINQGQTDEEKIYNLLLLAEIYKIKSDFNAVEETITEAIKISETSNFNVNLYNLLGIAYQEKKDYDSAIENYSLSSNYSKDELYKLIIKNNIAVVYLDQNKYQEATEILKPLMTNGILVKHPLEVARVSDNLGFSYFKLKKDSLAKKYLELGLKIRDSINDDYNKIASYIHLAEFYKDKNPLLSKEYAQNAYTFASKVNSPNDRLEALDLLLKNPTNNNTTLDYETFSYINDSINRAKQIAKNQFAKIKYDSSLANKKSEKLKSENTFILFAFTAFIIIVVLAYFLFISRNKRILQKTAYQTEIRISKQLHDELANDVYNTMTFAETQDLSNPNKKEQFLNQIETIYNRTRNISLENSEIDTGEHFKENLSLLLSGFNSENTNVIIKNFEAINWSKTKKITKITIYRILQELLVNMKKHSQSNLVVIGFEDKGKSYEINYSDNGIGNSKTIKFKNGLQNVENRIKTINGTFTFETESQKGFKAKIVFPK